MMSRLPDIDYEISVTGPYKKVNAATKSAIAAREESKVALDDAFDKAVDFGWELGIVDHKSQVLDLIDALKEKLSPEEVDAHVMLDIIHKGVLGLTDVKESDETNE